MHVLALKLAKNLKKRSRLCMVKYNVSRPIDVQRSVTVVYTTFLWKLLLPGFHNCMFSTEKGASSQWHGSLPALSLSFPS
jgi:hypothetical protein